MGVCSDLLGVALYLVEIVERVGSVDLAGVDQAHEDVTYVRAPLGAIEERVLAVNDRSFQRILRNVVERHAGFTQELTSTHPIA